MRLLSCLRADVVAICSRFGHNLLPKITIVSLNRDRSGFPFD
jgi:hypothetical protein